MVSTHTLRLCCKVRSRQDMHMYRRAPTPCLEHFSRMLVGCSDHTVAPLACRAPRLSRPHRRGRGAPGARGAAGRARGAGRGEGGPWAARTCRRVCPIYKKELFFHCAMWLFPQLSSTRVRGETLQIIPVREACRRQRGALRVAVRETRWTHGNFADAAFTTSKWPLHVHDLCRPGCGTSPRAQRTQPGQQQPSHSVRPPP